MTMKGNHDTLFISAMGGIGCRPAKAPSQSKDDPKEDRKITSVHPYPQRHKDCFSSSQTRKGGKLER